MSAETWPPPATDSARWQTVDVRIASGQWDKVRVRPVLLWGKRVLIDDEHRVWCTYCGGVFHTVAELGHPFNGCPTGIVRRGVGPIVISFDPESPNYAPEPPRRRDVWDMPW